MAEGLTPAWVQNLRLEWACVEPQTSALVVAGVPVRLSAWDLRLAILDAYAPAVHRWLDATPLTRDAAARALYAEVAALWEACAIDWAPLRPLARPAVTAGYRLHGLRTVATEASA